MRVWVDYGKTGLDADLPDENLCGVLRISSSPALADTDAAFLLAIPRGPYVIPYAGASP